MVISDGTINRNRIGSIEVSEFFLCIGMEIGPQHHLSDSNSLNTSQLYKYISQIMANMNSVVTR